MPGRRERHYLPPDWLERLVQEANTEIRRSMALQIAQKVNLALSSLADRLDEMDKPGATIDGRVEQLAVQGRQGLFHLTWIRMIEVDGYIIEVFSDSAATSLVLSRVLPGASTVQWQYPVGNVAITRYFRVTPYIQRASGGIKLGTPSTLVSGLSVAYGAGEAAPTAPTAAPTEYSESGGLSGRINTL